MSEREREREKGRNMGVRSFKPFIKSFFYSSQNLQREEVNDTLKNKEKDYAYTGLFVGEIIKIKQKKLEKVISKPKECVPQCRPKAGLL